MKRVPATKDAFTAAARSFAGQDPGPTNQQAILIIVMGVAFSIGIIFHWEPLNGVIGWTNWEWPWRDIGVLRTSSIMLPPLVAIGWVLWRIEKREPSHPWQLLVVLALSNYSLQVLGMLSDPRGLEFVGVIVASPVATGYFSDATEIQGRLVDWLRHFHQTPLYQPHSATHPPGPILYYYVFFKLFGASLGAMLGGCFVGLLGSVGVIVIFKFAGLWTSEPKPRIVASALYALLPALTVFFPEFDQVYPILSMLLILQWVEVLRNPDDWLLRSLSFGFLLALTTFLAYNVLSIGAFFVYYGLYGLWTDTPRYSGRSHLLRASAAGLAVVAVIYAALWLTTGYNALAAFRHALSNQFKIAQLMKRPYAASLLSDPYDFFLGAGILALPLMILRVRKIFRNFDPAQASSVLTLIGVGTILTVNLSGVPRTETARVWLFLQPLLVVPAAIELSQVRWRWRLSIFVLQWWIVACLKAKMNFLEA